MGTEPSPTTMLDRVKTQAEVLVPLLKRLESEFGRERTHCLLRETLSPYYRSIAEQWVREAGGDRTQTLLRLGAESANGEAITVEPVESPPGEARFNVVKCQYSAFFQELGEPELGFLLVCSADYDFADAVGAGLERTQTIMQGADHCDFRWRLPTG